MQTSTTTIVIWQKKLKSSQEKECDCSPNQIQELFSLHLVTLFAFVSSAPLAPYRYIDSV